jgi:hypothetical protein
MFLLSFVPLVLVFTGYENHCLDVSNDLTLLSQGANRKVEFELIAALAVGKGILIKVKSRNCERNELHDYPPVVCSLNCLVRRNTTFADIRYILDGDIFP